VAILLVQLPPFLPIILIVVVFALVRRINTAHWIKWTSLDLAAGDIALLSFSIVLLREPHQLLLAPPFGLGLERHELLLSGIIDEFYKH
jgi:hypothetical protein